MGRTGVMVCGHGSRDQAACDEFRHVVGRIAARCRTGRSRWATSSSPGRSSARGSTALRARGVDRVLAVPGMLFAAGHVKNDVPSVLNAYAAEHGLAIEMGRDLGIDAEAAPGGARPDRGRAAPRGGRRPARRDLPAGRRPRHLGQRRQRQRRQGRAHALGGHGLRPCRDRLFRRRPPAHRRGARPRRPARLPPHRRLPLLPVHRRPGPAHLRRRGRRGRAPSRDRHRARRPTSTTTRW